MYKVYIKQSDLEVYVKEIIMEYPGASKKFIKRKLKEKVNFRGRLKRSGYDDICNPIGITNVVKKLEKQGVIITATRQSGDFKIPVYLPIVN